MKKERDDTIFPSRSAVGRQEKVRRVERVRAPGQETHRMLAVEGAAIREG